MTNPRLIRHVRRLANRLGLRRALWVVGAALGVLLVWFAMSKLVVSLRRDETWARIQREGVLRVGMDASYPPFEVVDGEGRFRGYDVDLAGELARRWGVRAEFVNVHFDGLYDALKTGKFDLVISALPYDRTMTRDVLYSLSYFNGGQVLLARREDMRLQELSDLEGKRVSVELGAQAHQLVRQLSRDEGLRIDVVPQRDPEQVVGLLLGSQVDALVCDRLTAHGYLSRGHDLRLAGLPLTDEPYVIAARRESRVLLEQVNAALREWHENGLLEDLQRRWF